MPRQPATLAPAPAAGRPALARSPRERRRRLPLAAAAPPAGAPGGPPSGISPSSIEPPRGGPGTGAHSTRRVADRGGAWAGSERRRACGRARAGRPGSRKAYVTGPRRPYGAIGKAIHCRAPTATCNEPRNPRRLSHPTNAMRPVLVDPHALDPLRGRAVPVGIVGS